MWPLLLTNAVSGPIGALEVRGARPDEVEARGAAFAEGIDGDWVLVHGHQDALDRLEADFEVRGRVADHRSTAREGSPTLEELEEELLALGAFVIGESVEGRDILALERGAGPRVRILGGHHGDEVAGIAVAMELARTLDVSDRHVLFVPIVNPDAYVARSRQNANEVDVNRNFDFAWAESVFSGVAPFSEPETRAIRTSSVFFPPATGLSLHAGAANIGYPWNHTRDPSPEEEDLVLLGAVYAAACTTEDFSLLNGADWYVTYGDTNDWALGRQGAWDYTVEVSVEKAPADPSAAVAEHLEAARAFVDAPMASEGRTFDAVTGRPVQASLSADGVSTFLSSPLDGSWAHRQPGPFVVLAAGYEEGSSDDDGLVPGRVLEFDTVLASRQDSEVELAIDADAVWLSRPGFDDEELVERGGAWVLEATAVPVGAWDLHADDAVRKRGVLVSDARLPATVDAVALDAELLLEGRFASGTRAYAIFGSDRALEPMEVLDETPTSLLLDISSLVADGTVDLVIVSKGVEIGIADITGEPVFDIAREPARDSGSASARVEAEPRTGCSSSPGPSFHLAIAIGALFARRRRHVADSDARRM